MKTIVSRKIDNLGRVHLPVEIRKKLNISEGDYVTIETIGDEIIIGKEATCCKLCGKDTENKINEMFICSDCIKFIKTY